MHHLVRILIILPVPPAKYRLCGWLCVDSLAREEPVVEDAWVVDEVHLEGGNVGEPHPAVANTASILLADLEGGKCIQVAGLEMPGGWLPDVKHPTTAIQLTQEWFRPCR